MINMAVILGIAIVTTYLVHIWIENKAMKRAMEEKEQPKYISDLERNILNAEVELDTRMGKLRDELSKVVAKELPKAIVGGKDTLTVYLLSSYGGKYIPNTVVKISDTQYNLISRHSKDTKWLSGKLLSKGLDTYVKTVDARVDYSWDSINTGIKLYIRIKV